MNRKVPLLVWIAHTLSGVILVILGASAFWEMGYARRFGPLPTRYYIGAVLAFGLALFVFYRFDSCRYLRRREDRWMSQFQTRLAYDIQRVQQLPASPEPPLISAIRSQFDPEDPLRDLDDQARRRVLYGGR